MKNWLSNVVLAGFLVTGAAVWADGVPTVGDPKTPGTGSAAQSSGENLSPADNAARHQEKIARREARLATLRTKKAAGTLTAKEEHQLARLENWQAHRGKKNHHAKETPASTTGGGN